MLGWHPFSNCHITQNPTSLYLYFRDFGEDFMLDKALFDLSSHLGNDNSGDLIVHKDESHHKGHYLSLSWWLSLNFEVIIKIGLLIWNGPIYLSIFLSCISRVHKSITQQNLNFCQFVHWSAILYINLPFCTLRVIYLWTWSIYSFVLASLEYSGQNFGCITVSTTKL